MKVPIVEAKQPSDFFNPAKDAEHNLNQVMQMRGLQEREQHNQLLVRKEQIAEQQKADFEKRAGEATQAFMKNPGDPNAQLGIAQIMVETGKAEDVVKWMRHDTGLAAVAKANGFQVNELQGMSDLPAEQFKQLYGPELEKNLKVQASELADLHQDNAKFTEAFKTAVGAETYYEKNANEVLGADRAIINFISSKKDLSASEKERLTTAETSLAKSEAKIAEQRKSMDDKVTKYASTVRDGALYQQDALARRPHANARQQQLYSDVYTLKASVADAYLAYKNEATPENKRAFQGASERYDAKVKEIAIRATEYKTEAEQQAMANTQKTVQGMKAEEADREAQARFAALPLDQQTSQSAEKIARAMLAEEFALPDITKMRGAGKDPNKPLTEFSVNLEKLTPEQAGRFAGLNQAMEDIQSIQKLIEPTPGKIDRTVIFSAQLGGIPFTKGRDLNSLMNDAIDAKTRASTGAAATDGERRDFNETYKPAVQDSDSLIRSKLTRLNRFMQMSVDVMDPKKTLRDRMSIDKKLVKITVEDRYKQLEKEGKSKADAFAIMRDEGF